jgi:hypothetical protein
VARRSELTVVPARSFVNGMVTEVDRNGDWPYRLAPRSRNAASTTLLNSTMLPSPVRLTIRLPGP